MTRIQIKVTAGAKKSLVKKEGDILKVLLTAPAVEGKANKALIELLAQHFHVRKRQIQIIKGLKSRNKTVSINKITDGEAKGVTYARRTN